MKKERKAAARRAVTKSKAPRAQKNSAKKLTPGQAENDLRLDEQRLRQIIDLDPHYIFAKDAEGRYILANKAVADAYQTTVEELIGKTDADFSVSAETVSRFRADDLEVIRAGKPKHMPQELVYNNDGTVQTFATTKIPFTFSGTNTPAVLGVAVDITEFKQVEQALRESEARLHTVLEASSNPLLLSSLSDGIVLYSNSSLARLLEIPLSRLIGRRVDEFYFDPTDHTRMLEGLEGRGSLREFEALLCRSDGTTVWVSISSEKTLLEGRPCILSCLYDITERKRAEGLQAAVYRISEAANSAASMDELFRSVHAIIGQVMPAQNFYIALYDEPGNLLSFPYYVDEVDESASIPAAQPGRGMTEYVLRTGRPLLSDVENFEALARAGEVELVGPPSPIWIGAPLVVEGRTIGVIALQDYHDPHVYTERELRMLEFVSGQVAKAIERTRLYEDIQRSNRILTALQEATLPLIKQTELSEVLQEILKQATGLFETTDGYIYLTTLDDSEIVQSMGIGSSTQNIGARLRKGEGLAGKAWETKKPLIVDDYETWSGRSKIFEGMNFHASAAVPLMSKSKIMGVLGIGHVTPDRRFDQEDLELLTRFAELAAIAIENARLFTLSQQELGERKIAEEAMRAAEARYRTLVEQLPVVVYVNPADAVGSTVYVSPQIKDFLGYTQEEWLQDPAFWEKALHPEDRARILAEVDKMRYSSDPFDEEYRMITRDGRVIWVQDQATLLHDPEGHPLLWQGLMADITERKHAEEQIKLQIERLKALRTIDMFIASGADLHLTLQTILHQAVNQLGVDAAAILLLNSSMHMLEFSERIGFRSRGIEQTTLRVGEDFAGRAALQRETVSVEDLSVYSQHPLFAIEGFTSYHGIPLIAKGEVKGVLEVFNRSRMHTDSEWMDFLDSLAGQAALAVDNASLFESLQRTNIELSLAYETTLEGWSAALDLRDKETEGHTQRVTNLTLKLADAMGVSEKERVHIRRGALLHDIGKMGIPDRILLKPDVLTGEEWEIMRQHPVYAYNLLSKIEHLRPALDIPYCHHERWDGSGYPRGLKAEAIPLSARIFAVADVWDALCSDRPYRPAWSKEQALGYIKSLSGAHFDPKVVETFLRVINEG
jgi:PAS domain S-box-containing protein/putative nucleotidyltransferase with HDIG domain